MPTDPRSVCFLLVDSFEIHRIIEREFLCDQKFQVFEAGDAVQAEEVFGQMLEIGCEVTVIINSRIEAGSGGEALGYLPGYCGSGYPDPINGPHLAARLLIKKPNLRILFILATTTPDVVLAALRKEYPGLDPSAVTFLQRPFDRNGFLPAVQKTLS